MARGSFLWPSFFYNILLMMKKFIFIILSVLTVSAYAGNVSWLRYPSISPDGKSVVFSYGGDLYIVASGGGRGEDV